MLTYIFRASAASYRQHCALYFFPKSLYQTARYAWLLAFCRNSGRSTSPKSQERRPVHSPDRLALHNSVECLPARFLAALLVQAFPFSDGRKLADRWATACTSVLTYVALALVIVSVLGSLGGGVGGSSASHNLNSVQRSSANKTPS